MPFGRTVLGTVGTTIQLSADGEPKAKAGGVTLDWASFAAVGADTTVNDGVVVPAGAKYARYGQLITRITASGRYGPYDPAAADGRQLLVRGQAFLVNRTVLNNDPRGEYPEAIEGGRVWKARLIQAGTGTASLAAGPTLANLEATFPLLTYADTTV
jgi:hypothetical protein